MSFYFSFTHNERAKLHEHADALRQLPHVPEGAIDFVKHAIDTYPDGTLLIVVGTGHKAHVNPGDAPTANGYHNLIAANMDIKVTPIVPTPAPSERH